MAFTVKDWNIEAETGYKPLTTFYQDLSIADAFGADAVKDTYKRVFDAWKDNVKYFTEFVMALNWKSWEHNGHNEELCELYCKLFHEADEYCCKNYKGEDAEYYFQVTD